jgi:DNA primase
VSSTGGANGFKEEWVELLKDKEIFLALDNDGAGAEGTVKLLKFFPEAKVCLFDAPVKDVTDFIIAGGDFHSLMKHAENLNTKEKVEADKDKNKPRPARKEYFYEAWLNNYYKKIDQEKKQVEREGKRKLITGDLEQAKQYPIDRIIKVRNDGKALCPFHQEKTPSAHYYRNTNTLYCFGCGKGADAISVYMEVNHCSFKEALKNMTI